MHQPKSANLMSEKQRCSIPVLVYLLLVLTIAGDIILNNNYGVFSFTSFSEASKAVVFIANLVDVIMDALIALCYKSKYFLLYCCNQMLLSI